MDLIGTKWFFCYNLSERLETTLTFCDKINAVTGSNSKYTWKFINEMSISLDLNDVVRYEGSIVDGKIIGYAINFQIGRKWLWEATPFIEPIVQSKEIIFSDFICQKWKLENLTEELDNDEITFQETGNLISHNFGRSNWTIDCDTTLIFWLSNEYIKYTGNLIGNQIIGKGTNKAGFIYDFKLTLLAARQYLKLKLKTNSELGYFTNQPIFKITGEKKHGFTFYALTDYYPKRYFTKDPDIIYVRQQVYNFKLGKNSFEIASLISRSIENEPFFEEIKFNAIFCIIPASTKVKNINRFEKFCILVSSELSIANGFKTIDILYDREELKGKTVKSKTDNLFYNESLIRGRDVLLFDDVITRGTSFLQNALILKEKGAKSVTGIFLSKTVYCDYL